MKDGGIHNSVLLFAHEECERRVQSTGQTGIVLFNQYPNLEVIKGRQCLFRAGVLHAAFTLTAIN
jgi:hypothetical protein